MIALNDKQSTAITRLLGKLSEKTSVLGYLVATLGLFGVNDSGVLEKIAGVVALIASLLLVLFNDATVRSWFFRAAPTTAEAMEPEPVQMITEATVASTLQELPVSFLDKLSLISKLAPIVTTAVQVVEVIAPTSTGVQKLEKAKAGIAAAVEKASDIKESASSLWDVIEPLIEMVVAALKTPPAADVAAVEASKGA